MAVAEPHPIDPEPARYDTADPVQRDAGITAATDAVRHGDLVVIPTDTVYGIAADAFAPEAVQRLLDAKGRSRDMPPPVLIGHVATLDALSSDVPPWARILVDRFWPGALTLVLRQQTSLRWDLGETRGTVAVRMPDDPVAVEVLSRTGPLAVSSANTSGETPAQTAQDAIAMLGPSVRVVLDAGPAARPVPSTIVDCTGVAPRLLRAGALDVTDLVAALAPHVDCEGLRTGA